MKCDICKQTIYRKFYTFENKTFCHACVEERSKLIDEGGNDKRGTNKGAKGKGTK